MKCIRYVKCAIYIIALLLTLLITVLFSGCQDGGGNDVHKGVEILKDTKFNKGGFDLLSPVQGAIKITDHLDFGMAPNLASWTMPQWSSIHDIKGAKPVKNKDGSITYQNEGKKITLGNGKVDYDLELAVYATKEYLNGAKKREEPWPHLGISQDIENPVNITEISSVNINIEAKLLMCENFTGNEYNPKIHTAHIIGHFYISNINPKSSDFKKHYSFAIPIYDFRYDYPPKVGMVDKGTNLKIGTNAFVYGPAGNDLWDGTLKSGKWQRMQADLLPYIISGFEEAKKNGYFQDSELQDMGISKFNTMWEVSGIFDCSMQFRNLSVRIYSERQQED